MNTIVKLALVLMALVSTIQAQTQPTAYFYGYIAGYKWIKLGPTLKVENGQIDVVFPTAPPPPPVAMKAREIILPYDATQGGWRMPDKVDVSTMDVFVGGLRYPAQGNWKIEGGTDGKNYIKPLADNMPPDIQVFIDYTMLL